MFEQTKTTTQENIMNKIYDRVMDSGRWFDSIFNSLAEEGASWVLPGENCSHAVPQNSYPKFLRKYGSAAGVESAMRTVLGGSATKGVGRAVVAAVPADTSVDLGSSASAIGMRVRIGGSVNNFLAAPFELELRDNATVLGKVDVFPATKGGAIQWFEFFVFGFTDVSGTAEIAKITQPVAFLELDNNPHLVGSDTWIAAESLNLRDFS